MGSKLDDKALEELATAEILKEAKRGREREKTLGSVGWKKPVNKPNKLFIGRSLASALRQTKYADQQRKVRREISLDDVKSSSKDSKKRSARIEANDKPNKKRKRKGDEKRKVSREREKKSR